MCAAAAAAAGGSVLGARELSLRLVPKACRHPCAKAPQACEVIG